LAVTQSTNPSVKELAQQMIDDHTKAFDSLKEIAQNKGIMLPFESVGSGSGSTGSSGSTGTGSVGSPGTGSTGSTGGTGSDTMGSDRMGSTGTGSTSGTGSGSTGTTGSTGTGAGSDPSVSGTPGASDPAASGERMGAGDRMNTEGKNVYGQLPRDMQKKYDDLAKLSGDKFDREYLGNLIDNHKKSVKLFEKESKNGEDPELKSWATNTLPTLKHHLEMAQSVEKEIKNRRTGSM
jgi:predicted outer membrane protein